jgi:predicted DNA-binding protein
LATQTTTIRLPVDLYKRTKKLAGRLNKTMSTIIADGLWNEVAQLEKRLREESDDKSRDEDDKREKRRRAIRGDAPLASEAPTSEEPEDESEGEDAPAIEDEDALYAHHAQKIVEAYGDPVERRLLAREGIRAICEAQPLTAEVLVVERRLHDWVTKLRSGDVAPPKKAAPAPPRPGEPSILEKMFRYVVQPAAAETGSEDKEESE